MDQKEQEFLKSRIRDAVRITRERNIPRFVGFLDSKAIATAVNEAQKEGADISLFGGYEAAERCFFASLPGWCDSGEGLFPIVKLKFTNKSDRPLGHRDILGSLMAQGIERDTVGDILPGHPVSVAFVAATVAEHIIASVDKIGNCGVTVEKCETEFLPSGGSFLEMSDTVASARLDCVVASLAKTSRQKAAELIEDGSVAVGSVEVLKMTKIVKPGDIVSIRRVGKFIIDAISDKSRKNRIILKYRKYN